MWAPTRPYTLLYVQVNVSTNSFIHITVCAGQCEHQPAHTHYCMCRSMWAPTRPYSLLYVQVNVSFVRSSWNKEEFILHRVFLPSICVYVSPATGCAARFSLRTRIQLIVCKRKFQEQPNTKTDQTKNDRDTAGRAWPVRTLSAACDQQSRVPISALLNNTNFSNMFWAGLLSSVCLTPHSH